MHSLTNCNVDFKSVRLLVCRLGYSAGGRAKTHIAFAADLAASGRGIFLGMFGFPSANAAS
eukprot:4729122-Amphidinium_carterae.1